MLVDEDLDSHSARLATLLAFEREFETQDADQALSELQPIADPIRTRAALQILIRAKRLDEAVSLVQNNARHPIWADLGAYVLARKGLFANAVKMVECTDEHPDSAIMRGCRARLALGIQERISAGREDKSLLEIHSWSDEDLTRAQEALLLLDPLLSLVKANRKIRGGHELAAVRLAIYFAHIINDEPTKRAYGLWLLKYQPVDLLAVELCLRGIIECPLWLADRLRLDHPASVHHALVAVLVRRDLMREREKAFLDLEAIVVRANTNAEKRSVAAVIFETAVMCSDDHLARAVSQLNALSLDNSRLQQMLSAVIALRSGNVERATSLIQGARDENDAVWWQAQAQLCEARHDLVSAGQAWETAARLLPHPDVIRRSAQAALARRRYQAGILALEQLVETGAAKEPDLKRLAWSLTQIGDHARAAHHLQRLLELSPDSPGYRLALSHSYAFMHRFEDAIASVAVVCDKPDAPVEAFIAQSQLFTAVGKPEQGLAVMERKAADHWDDPAFLVQYMNCAHAAGRDDVGSSVLKRLMELHREGRVSSEMFATKSLDEVRALMLDHQRRRDESWRQIVAGDVPWLWEDRSLGLPLLPSWLERTQSMLWLDDEVSTRGARSIYATNGAVLRGREPELQLGDMDMPLAGRPVVCDLTALVTLAQLGVLDDAARFFGRLLLPSEYRDIDVVDVGRLIPHQASRAKSLMRIRSAIDRRSIDVVEDSGTQAREVSEYRDAELAPAYTLRDVATALATAQKVSPQAMVELDQLCAKPRHADSGAPEIMLGEQLRFDLDTLRSLAALDAFDAVFANFSVRISAEARDEVNSELAAHESQQVARRLHDQLWTGLRTLSESGHVEFRALDEVDEVARPLQPQRLALTDKCVLVADDRVVQTVAAFGGEGEATEVCGTPEVLEVMRAAGVLSNDRLASMFLKLLKWRYRFLVVPPQVLVAWAKAAVHAPPGDALLDAAAYLHDCLRDPGLHCGPTAGVTPLPLAMKFVFQWVNSIAQFLADLWEDTTIADEVALRLTEWTGHELAPSCPRGLFQEGKGVHTCGVIQSALFRQTLVRVFDIEDATRAQRCLQVLAGALGITSDEATRESVEAMRVV